MNKYKAIFFDFDDTLGNREQYAYDCYRGILKSNTNIEDDLLFEAIVQDCMLWDEKGNCNKRHIKEMLKLNYDIDLPYEDFNTYWDSQLWKYTVPQPDAAETLTELSKRYQLGIITNGPSEGQRNKLKVSGLESFFQLDTIIVSGDYGYHKPDKRLFLAACDKLKVAPEESVYVGDIFARDVLGSASAGMKPVWIWTQGERKCSIEVLTIHKLKDLLNYF